ncbi:MAG: ISLre2 family transposase [Lachnospiraceae bacterium]|nr:ISLre2 family transposase [Lachnospiraceae bacterium]
MDELFSKLECIIYEFVCEFARNITALVLESIDERLMNERNKKRYRHKSINKTTIKTIYGNVEFERRYYFDNDTGKYVYLLDDAMKINRVGLFSENMANLIIKQCINEPYNKAAASISRTTGIDISTVGAWKLVQEVGKNIEADENINIQDMDRGINKGAKQIEMLFQETDGVFLRMQGKDRKKAKNQELKLATIYEGWNDSNRHELINKKVIAGFEDGASFMKRRLAFVKNIYNYDKIPYKMVNGDGASWIEPLEVENITYQQLDQFHIYNSITGIIKNKKIRKKILNRLSDKNVEKLLDTIIMYADSIDNDEQTNKEAEGARDLYTYLYNNKDGLIKYKDTLDIPEPPEGIEYRNMGVQENQNCTLVTMRMKHRRMSWSVAGANNLAKVICAEANGDLDKYIQNTFEIMLPIGYIEVEKRNIISAAKIPQILGKGNSKYAELIRSAVPEYASSSITARVLKGIIDGGYH